MQDEDQNQTATAAPESENLPQESTTETSQSQENNSGEEANNTQANDAAEPSKGDEEPKERKTPWFQSRIDHLTAEKHNARREADQLKAQNQALLEQLAVKRSPNDTQPEPSKPTQPRTSQEEIERLAEEKAQVIAAQAQYRGSLDTIWNNGLEEFPDFRQAVTNLENLQELFAGSLPIMVDLNAPHKVLHHLSKDLDEAARIFSLPHNKQAIELTRLEASLGKSKPVSNAPSPLRPVEGKGKSSFDPNDPNVDQAKWMEWREKQLAEKRGRR